MASHETQCFCMLLHAEEMLSCLGSEPLTALASRLYRSSFARQKVLRFSTRKPVPLTAACQARLWFPEDLLLGTACRPQSHRDIGKMASETC